MKKKAADSKDNEMKLDLHAACLVNCSQGKDTGVLFRLHYIRQQTSIGCDASS